MNEMRSTYKQKNRRAYDPKVLRKKRSTIPKIWVDSNGVLDFKERREGVKHYGEHIDADAPPSAYILLCLLLYLFFSLV